MEIKGKISKKVIFTTRAIYLVLTETKIVLTRNRKHLLLIKPNQNKLYMQHSPRGSENLPICFRNEKVTNKQFNNNYRKTEIKITPVKLSTLR